MEFALSTQSPLPLIAMEADPPDFDYAAFLQEEDADYMAEESSVSGSGTSNLLPEGTIHSLVPLATAAAGERTSGRSKTPSPTNSGGNSPPKQRLERRGHTKSRRGCFNCKRRRIKCQETRPACGHCTKTGLKCEYPTLPQVNHQPQHQIPLFSLQDMRFFQHFLMKCTPHHPLGNETIWTHEVPCLSQSYEYLMHAILALAASDLTVHDPSLVAAAMIHRVKAIKAIKKTLADVPKANTFEEGNALLATCFALTFQSVMLDDGMAEYMTFIRGVVIVAIQMYMKGAKFLFHDFLGDDQVEMLRPIMEALPLINRAWSEAAITSVRNLEPLCTGDVERGYYELILQMAEALTINSFEAYRCLTRHYTWWMQLPHDKFQQVIDPNNQVGVLLASHWIAMKQIMATITEMEHAYSKNSDQEHADGDPDLGIIRWLKFLNRNLEPEYLAYNQWPMWVEAELDRDRRAFGKSR